MIKWAAQFEYGWRRHGPTGLVRLVFHNLAYTIERRYRGQPLQQLDSFDSEYGTDTDGIREIRTLDAASLPNAPYAVRYGPSGAQGVRQSLDKLKIDPRDFIFIDFGSGKGRVLLIAAGLPFKAVIGIEFSRELHETAVRNIARFPRELIRAATVTSLCDDAASFALPAAHLDCYFHNPFGPPVLSQVVRGLEAHCAQGYHVRVVYLDPRHRAVFEASDRFAVLDETASTLLLTTER
jgi:hypothetical protein